MQSILGSLKKSELDILFCNGQQESYEKNTIIIDEGDHSNSAYIINSGRVKVFLSDEQGKEIVLSELKAGEYFGEMALIDKNERSAGVMAMECTKLTVISQKNFRECLQSNPDISERIMLGLVANLREANKKISSLVFMDAYGRVRNMLLELAEDQDGLLVVDEKPTHQHMANVVGASREMITRILKNMVADGHISIEGKRILIKQKAALWPTK
ncbi:MAG: cyclic nucleotide-binding domain-containing protein [Gallionella sp.]|nr:cyclic nucleotide-binding domain-containing protein [Gallionella sp.]